MEEQGYIPFGPEWATVVMKMRKAEIIALFGEVGKQRDELKEALEPFRKLADAVLSEREVDVTDLKRPLYAYNFAEITYSDLRKVRTLLCERCHGTGLITITVHGENGDYDADDQPCTECK